MKRLSQRQFVGYSLAATCLAGPCAESRSESTGGDRATHRLYWGDLHNHNAVGYAVGSLERSIELARAHRRFTRICATS